MGDRSWCKPDHSLVFWEVRCLAVVKLKSCGWAAICCDSGVFSLTSINLARYSNNMSWLENLRSFKLANFFFIGSMLSRLLLLVWALICWRASSSWIRSCVRFSVYFCGRGNVLNRSTGRSRLQSVAQFLAVHWASRSFTVKGLLTSCRPPSMLTMNSSLEVWNDRFMGRCLLVVCN